MINSFNGSSLAGVQLGYSAAQPTLSTGGISSNGGNISAGNGGLQSTLAIPQVMGLTPLFDCCSTIITPGTNGCMEFTIDITGTVTEGIIGVLVTPPGGQLKSWYWHSPPNTPMNCHEWALDFPNVMNVIFPNLSVTLTAPITDSCTVQICPKTEADYGTTVRFVKCNWIGSGSISYSPEICNVTYTLGTAPTISYGIDGCGDCRQGEYLADEIPDDRKMQLPVFADPNSSGYETSDYNTFLLQYPNGYDAITNGDFSLEELVNGTWTTKTTLTDGTLGIPFNNYMGVKKWPFYAAASTPEIIFAKPINSSCSIVNYQGFFLDWRKVYNNYGAGVYRFSVGGHTYGPGTGTSYCFKSIPFCLSLFDCHKADHTLKFEAAYTGGNRGSSTQQNAYWSLNCNGSNPFYWVDSIRFNGFFGKQGDDLTRDMIKYQTGIEYKVRDELIKKFELWIDPMPQWFHDRFSAYALMADKLYVTDDNYNNANYNLKHFWVVCDSGYEPQHTSESRYARIEGTVKFKEGQQFIFADRC